MPSLWLCPVWMPDRCAARRSEARLLGPHLLGISTRVRRVWPGSNWLQTEGQVWAHVSCTPGSQELIKEEGKEQLHADF